MDLNDAHRVSPPPLHRGSQTVNDPNTSTTNRRATRSIGLPVQQRSGTSELVYFLIVIRCNI